MKNANTAIRPLLYSVGTIVLAGFGERVVAAVEFHPRATLSVTWTDNFTLVRDDDPTKEGAYIGQANPGFTFIQDSKRVKSALDYQMQNLFFYENSDRNSTFHQAAANFAFELIDDYFFLDGNGSYSQQIVDPKKPVNINSLFGVDNQADALVAQLAPALRHEFDLARIDLRYARGILDFKGSEANSGLSGLQDAETETHFAVLGSPDDLTRVSWQTYYRSQRAQYDASPEFRFDEARGELGLLVGGGLRLIGRYGRESDVVVDSSAGGLDLETWEGGLRWSPGLRTQLEIFYGDRFYGHSYSGSLRHTARFAEWDVSYTEGPITQAQELLQRPVLIEVTPPEAQAPANRLVRQSPAVYLQKLAEGRVHLGGRRTQVDLFATDHRRRYLTGSFEDEHQRGGSLAISRSLANETRITLGGGVTKTDFEAGDNFREVTGNLGFHRQFGARITASLTAAHIRRTGLFENRVNLITASISGQL